MFGVEFTRSAAMCQLLFVSGAFYLGACETVGVSGSFEKLEDSRLRLLSQAPIQRNWIDRIAEPIIQHVDEVHARRAAVGVFTVAGSATSICTGGQRWNGGRVHA